MNQSNQIHRKRKGRNRTEDQEHQRRKRLQPECNAGILHIGELEKILADQRNRFAQPKILANQPLRPLIQREKSRKPECPGPEP